MRPARPRLALSVLALAALCAVAGPALADGDPDLDWRTIETKHFRVHYDRPLGPIASRVASLAEVIHGRIASALAYTPTQITEMVITDDTDSANGSATALPRNTVRLFVTAPDDLSALGDYDDWYTALITHEYTHIAHLDNISGVPAIVNAVLGKTLAPNQVQPRWIIEGMAVVSESEHTSAGRIRSTLFDMFMRADVVGDRIAGLDQISSTPYRWPQGNLWYLYGARFFRWIADIYGFNVLRAVSADYGAALMPWGINRAIRRATGRTYVELYEGFKDYLRRLYGEQLRAVEGRGLREGTPLTRRGRTAYYPRFVPRAARSDPKRDAEELLYYRDDFDTRSGLYRIALAAPKDGARREELVARTARSSSAAFTPAGDLVFHSVAPYKNYYYRDDLFFLPRGETSTGGEERARRRLTVGQRAQYADISPDGRRVVFTVNARGTSFLEIADMAPDGTISNRRGLFPSAPFEQAYTPRFSPDGRKVVYSVWAARGSRDIRMVDVATGEAQDLTRDRAMDMTPVFSSDGKTLYFASDRTGIFNIYAYDVATAKLAQVTNVRIGALMPAVSADGKTLVYAGYTSYGYDLYAMPIDPARFLPAIMTLPERPDPPTEPALVAHVHKRYDPLPSFGPRSYLFSLKPGDYGQNAITFTTTATDIVGDHYLKGEITVDPSAPQPTFSLDYSYGRLPVNFDAYFFHDVVPRGGFKRNGQDIKYDEYQNGLTTGISYAHRSEFSSHSIGLSFSVSRFSGQVPFGTRVDPYTPVEAKPPAGNLNILHLGYNFSCVEGGYAAAGRTRGFHIGVALDYASPYTGSSFTVRGLSGGFTGYLEMPWRGHQTLAFRAAGAVAGGDYSRGGTYYVGGYDLEGNSFPSTVLSGVFNGSFVLRGYPPWAYAGSEYLLTNLEYRIPIVHPDRGLSTLPLYLRRIDANLFVDYGGAFDYLDLRAIRFFHRGALIDSPQLHTAIGAEIWLGLTLGYLLDTQIRVGYAYGFSPEAVKYGQPYFVASSAF